MTPHSLIETYLCSRITYCLHLQGRWIFFCNEDRGRRFLWNICNFLPDYIESWPRRQYFSYKMTREPSILYGQRIMRLVAELQFQLSKATYNSPNSLLFSAVWILCWRTLTCKKSRTKLLARFELGPGTSYRGHSWPATNRASISRT